MARPRGHGGGRVRSNHDPNAYQESFPMKTVAMLLGVVIALGPLLWVWLRNRRSSPT